MREREKKERWDLMYVHVQTWGEVAGPSEERTGGDGGVGIEERSTAAASSVSFL